MAVALHRRPERVLEVRRRLELAVARKLRVRRAFDPRQAAPGPAVAHDVRRRFLPRVDAHPGAVRLRVGQHLAVAVEDRAADQVVGGVVFARVEALRELHEIRPREPEELPRGLVGQDRQRRRAEQEREEHEPHPVPDPVGREMEAQARGQQRHGREERPAEKRERAAKVPGGEPTGKSVHRGPAGAVTSPAAAPRRRRPRRASRGPGRPTSGPLRAARAPDWP